MRKYSFISLLLLFVSLSSFSSNVLLDNIIEEKYKGEKVPDFTLVNDNEKYADVVENGKVLAFFSYKKGELTDTILDLKDFKKSGIEKISGYKFNSDETRVLIWGKTKKIFRRSFLTNYYVYNVRRKKLEILSKNGMQRDASFSPDGRSVAFARDNNLFVKRLNFGTELVVTKDGKKNEILNGISDWVYEEEFYNTKMYDWSTDSQNLVYLKFNIKNLPNYSYVKYGSGEISPEVVTIKYPFTGTENADLSINIFNLRTRYTSAIKVPNTKDCYIPRIKFMPNNALAVMSLNRDQNLFRIHSVDIKSKLATVILSDNSDTYIEPLYDFICFGTKDFTYLSEKDGYRHLYLYGNTGGLKKQITKGNFDVTAYLGRNEKTGVFYYQVATPEDVTRRKVCLTNAKGKSEEIGKSEGWAIMKMNNDLSYFVYYTSGLNSVPKVEILKKSGKKLREVINNSELSEKISSFNKKEKKKFDVNGSVFNGWILKPKNFDKSKKYPLVLIQYSGPGMQLVFDKFDFGWEYALSEKGFVVACVDVKGAEEQGRKVRRINYLNHLSGEADEVCNLAKVLANLSYVDSKRMGIWGWSYGASVGLLTMENKEYPFSACVAIAPLVSWEYYDTAYGERLMKSKKQNFEGYAKSSLNHVDDFKGSLLLVHGMLDDNVHVNQSFDFAEKMIKEGKDFDMFIFPSSNHSILGNSYRKFLFSKVLNFFELKL